MLKISKILCPIDFSEHSIHALKMASDLAQEMNTRIVALHVTGHLPTVYPYTQPEDIDLSAYQLRMEESALQALQAQVQKTIHKEVSHQAVVSSGIPADEIVRVAQKENIDLIVIASHGSAGWQNIVFGSVTDKVLRLAPCPVLVIRRPAEKAA